MKSVEKLVARSKNYLQDCCSRINAYFVTSFFTDITTAIVLDRCRPATKLIQYVITLMVKYSFKYFFLIFGRR